MKKGGGTRKRKRDDKGQSKLAFAGRAQKVKVNAEHSATCIICDGNATFEFTARTHPAWRDFLNLTASDSSSRELLSKVSQSTLYACPKCARPRADGVKIEDDLSYSDRGLPVALSTASDASSPFSEWMFGRLIRSGVDPDTAMELARSPRLDVTACLTEADRRVCQNAEQATLNFVQNMSREQYEGLEAKRSTDAKSAFLNGDYEAGCLDFHGLTKRPNIAFLLEWPTFDSAHEKTLVTLRSRLYDWLLLQKSAEKWYGDAAIGYVLRVTDEMERFSASQRDEIPYNVDTHFSRMSGMLAHETRKLAEGLSAVDFANQLALPELLRPYAATVEVSDDTVQALSGPPTEPDLHVLD